MENKEKFMKIALKEAVKAYSKEEVPVGAIIVKDNKIIAKAHNLKETSLNAVSHAEILAIQKACKKLGSWRLTDCDMYVTLEPCTMCTGALINARIRKLYIGTNDPKTGACGSKINLIEDIEFNHKIEVEREIMQEECEKILKDFFKTLRERNKNGKTKNI